MIKGKLTDFFETGCEGTFWAFFEDNKTGYDGLQMLEEDDYLKVFDADGEIYWEGKIVYATETNLTSYPYDPENSQQVVCGLWIHWLQKHVDPEFWANMFFLQMRAELNKL